MYPATEPNGNRKKKLKQNTCSYRPLLVVFHPVSHCRVEQFVFLCFDHSVVHSLIEWFFSLCYFIRRSLKTEPACSNPHGAIVESSETP